MAIQQPGFRPVVDRPREQGQSNNNQNTSATSAHVPTGQAGTAIAPHLKQLEQNKQQGGGQGQSEGGGGHANEQGTVARQMTAKDAASARAAQQAQTAQAQGRPVPTNLAAQLSRGVNVFFVSSQHTRRFEKNYKPGGKNSSLSGKQLKVTGETPEEWEDQIEDNLRDARHQTRTMSGYHVAIGYYDE
jgi:hypothetical protein